MQPSSNRVKIEIHGQPRNDTSRLKPKMSSVMPEIYVVIIFIIKNFKKWIKFSNFVFKNLVCVV